MNLQIKKSFKYPHVFQMGLPTGPGLFYRKINSHFKIESMLECGKSSSLESLEWLQWQQSRYDSTTIHHAFNYGEKTIAGHKVDGYAEVKHEDGSIQKIAFQYMGCYWHFCRWGNCNISRATLEDGKRDHQILGLIQKEVDELIVTTSCEWQAEKTRFNWNPPEYCFFDRNTNRNRIDESAIFEKIESGDFYGLVRIDVQTPSSVVDRYKHLNFPLIFRKLQVTEDMLSDKMRELAKKANKEFPDITRTLTWNASDIVLTTPTIQFYLSLGMKISNLRWAAEYYPSKPFHKFVKELVLCRIEAAKNSQKALGERAKFCLNSCVGRFG